MFKADYEVDTWATMSFETTTKFEFLQYTLYFGNS
jgi:hypothetical protein